MDRNTIIGLSLIGALLIGFTYFNQPSAEEIKKQQEKEKKALAAKEKKEKSKKSKKDTKKVDITKGTSATSDSSAVVAKPFNEELVTISSDQLTVKISNKGGVVSSVALKNFESYDNFAKNDGKITPLVFFDKGDNVNQLEFQYKGNVYKTGNKAFDIVEKTANKVVLEHSLGEGKIRYTYSLKKGYDLKYDVSFVGLGKDVAAKSVLLGWKSKLRKSERLLSEQRRVSTVCYQDKEGKLGYTSEVANDAKEPEQDINWVAFKQSYFSSILTPANPIKAKGSKFAIYNFKEGTDEADSLIKRYQATMNLNLASTENSTISFDWFFGPNDYNVLKSYDKGYDDILNWGWGIFRWINLYAVQPVFNFFVESGVSVGLAILLVTIFLKLFLMPVQWKMFVSSAKMRILKPEIDAINAKYPNPEDKMKKQMDVMALQRESGASPLSGCLPMLLQMPILLAVFRFFPATFGLRQHGFLWAEDLSSYDSIADFNFSIPFYGDHVSLFTLLMAITTLVYTYLNSQNTTQPDTPGMPNMKVIMYFFPVMMIFFFNNYSSGLSYYYFISTLMTIVLMFAIKRFFVDEEKLKAKIAENRTKTTSGGGKKKSGFMARLEEAQRMQQEQMKNRKKK